MPAVLFILGISFVVTPRIAFADTVISADISEDATWTKEGSPYLVQSWITVGQDATLSIEPGVVVQFDSTSGIDFLGRLLAAGTPDAPIVFTSLAGNWDGLLFENETVSSSLDNIVLQHSSGIFDYFSKELSISNARIEDSNSGIEVYEGSLSLNNFSAENISGDAIDISFGSDAILKNITLTNVSSGVQVYVDSKADISNLVADTVRNGVITVYEKSSVRVASSTITNVPHSYGAIEAFNESSANISDLTIDGVSGGEALSVFNNSKMTVNDSSILSSNGYSAISAFSSGQLIAKNMKVLNGAGDGIEIFFGGLADIQNSVISGFKNGVGIADYGSQPDDPANSLSLTGNEIKNNGIGMGFYSDNSSYSISNNAIHDNASYGLVSYETAPANVSNNFWGDVSGPFNDPGNLAGKGDKIFFEASSTVAFSPWLSYWGTPPPDPCIAAGTCVSSVLFLPGIEGSRLYEGIGCGKKAEEKLWEPIADGIVKIVRGAGDNKVKDLFLDQTGSSTCSDIYTKEGDVVDTVGGSNIYKSLIDEMNGLKTDGTMNDWEPVAYDWRLSLDDLLSNGTERDGKIYYEEATSTPYIEQTLRALAASSKTGKVTIVAHSNGGLLAKALLNKLGNTEAANLVDKVIMVGAPQSGAPFDIGALLFGYHQGLPDTQCLPGLPDFQCAPNFVLSAATARAFTQNSPMAYHLLPSEDYLESTIGDANHPVIRFSGDGYAKEEAAYGSTIANRVALKDFLTAKDGGRVKPKANDLNSAEILNPTLIAYANSTHADLDFWSPPAGIEVDQIAGWGVDTVAGIDFYTSPPSTDVLTAFDSYRTYKPIITEDGDGTVTVPSALMMATIPNVNRYWLNLFAYNNETHSSQSHKDLFEIPSLRDFIKNSITNSTSTLPAYFSSSQPPANTQSKKLTFFLHSPLTLQLTDASGNVTGLAEDGSMTQNIPGSTYGEFGEVKYITVPEGNAYQLTMHGQASGTFSLDMQESSGGIVTTSSTIANVPTTASTLASLTITNGIDTTSVLTVDENGDGKQVIQLAPKSGETVIYAPVTGVASPSAGSAAGPGYLPYTPIGSISTPIATSTEVIPLTSTTTLFVASTTPSATTTIVVIATTRPLRVSKRPAASRLPIAVANTPTRFSQTASVYEASQQSILKRVGEAVYNSIHGLWVALMKFF